MVLHVLNKKPFETRPLIAFSIQLFFAALCLDICIKKSLCLHQWHMTLTLVNDKKKRKPVMIEFFRHVKPFVFSQEVCTANNHVNKKDLQLNFSITTVGDRRH